MSMVYGALANSLPDIDVISNFYMTVPDSLLAHRGFTHSILFAVLASALLSFIFYKWKKKYDMRYRHWLAVWLSGMFFHITLDSMTVYGTGLFEPFSHARISFNNIFVADPLYTLPLIVGSIGLLIAKSEKVKLRFIQFSLVLSTLYLIVTFADWFYVNRQLSRSLKDENIHAKNLMLTPTPLNNVLWFGLAAGDSGFYYTHYSILDKSEPVWQYTEQNQFLENKVIASEGLNKLKRFSRGYYVFQNVNDTIVFSDLRFGSIGGWYRENAPFVFRFYLLPGADNNMVIQQGRIDASTGEALSAIWKRMKGV